MQSFLLGAPSGTNGEEFGVDFEGGPKVNGDASSQQARLKALVVNSFKEMKQCQNGLI